MLYITHVYIGNYAPNGQEEYLSFNSALEYSKSIIFLDDISKIFQILVGPSHVRLFWTPDLQNDVRQKVQLHLTLHTTSLDLH
jgi:hypothetical protein